ncbi:MAG: LamG domain-containing protein [bacterium]
MKNLLLILFLLFGYIGNSQIVSPLLNPYRYVSEAEPIYDTVSYFEHIAVWYDKDETSGTTMVDSSANNLDGSISGMDIGESGKIGYSYYYNSSDQGETNDDDALSFVNPNSDRFTMAAWVNINTGASDYEPIVYKQKEYWFFVYSNKIQIRVYENSTSTYIGRRTVDSPVTYGQWEHVVVRYEGTGYMSDFRLFLNGVEQDGENQGSTTNITGMTNTTENLDVGRIPLSAITFDGYLDNVVLFNDTLSVSEIQDLYNSGTGKDYGDLITVQ